MTIRAVATGYVTDSDSIDVHDDDAPLDFGDAPTASQSGFASSYPTLVSNDGARHVIGNLFLGQLVDSESDGQPDSLAGRDATGAGDDKGAMDEDGVIVVSSIVTSMTTATKTSVSVRASQDGAVDAWIDFNQDGDWDDSGEQILASVRVDAGTNRLPFTVPIGSRSGETAARFRLSSTGGLLPTGRAEDGEVEDYLLLLIEDNDAEVMFESQDAGTTEISLNGDDIEIHSGSTELFRTPGNNLKQLNILGTEGDDTISIANLDAVYRGPISIFGSSGHDTLRLTGSRQALDLTQLPGNLIQGIESIDITGQVGNSLTLNADEVINLSLTSDTLRVQHDDDDFVSYGDGWTVGIPQIVDGQFSHTLTQLTATVQIVNTQPFRNPILSLDTNRDDSVSPLDALIIINRLNAAGSGTLHIPTTTAGLEDFSYIDTNGDGSVAPIDVLTIINALNDSARNAEGEQVNGGITQVKSSSTDHFGDRHSTDWQSAITAKRGLIELGLEAVSNWSDLPLLGTTTERVVNSSIGRATPLKQSAYAHALEEIFRQEMPFLVGTYFN